MQIIAAAIVTSELQCLPHGLQNPAQVSLDVQFVARLTAGHIGATMLSWHPRAWFLVNAHPVHAPCQATLPHADLSRCPRQCQPRRQEIPKQLRGFAARFAERTEGLDQEGSQASELVSAPAHRSVCCLGACKVWLPSCLVREPFLFVTRAVILGRVLLRSQGNVELIQQPLQVEARVQNHVVLASYIARHCSHINVVVIMVSGQLVVSSLFQGEVRKEVKDRCHDALGM
mmetsp:Transcript_73741/g.185862  ORF Transcript_73741/g.185862 Transcript_73741/m.185862 type:complete len:230 (-) Transcript_73741:1217-1906(-)